MYTKITISGKICTGKTSVFRELQNKLNWVTVSSGTLFRNYAKLHNLSLEKAEEQTELVTMKIDMMVKQKLTESGNLLVDAWLGGILAGDNPQVLKVLLIANDTIRFERFAKRERVSFEEAKKEVSLRDSSWFEKVKKIYKRSDFFDKKNYDLVIDTSSLAIYSIVQRILPKLTTSHQPLTTTSHQPLRPKVYRPLGEAPV